MRRREEKKRYQKLKANPTVKPEEHGMPKGYRNGCRCRPCVDARNAYRRFGRAARPAKLRAVKASAVKTVKRRVVDPEAIVDGPYKEWLRERGAL